MTISTDPWKLFRIALVLAVFTPMIIRPTTGAQPMYDGCHMTMHQE